MLSAVALGLLQGARHSIEPDHLAAVTVLVGTSGGARPSAWLGAVWGAGHTLSLVLVSVALLVIGESLPDDADRAFAIGVGIMLVALGLRALRGDDRAAAVRPTRSAYGALVVGAIHGLAGSSALTAMVFASLPSDGSRLAYITLFGAGSVIGMAVVSAAAGQWLHRVTQPRILSGLRWVIAGISIAIGVQTVVAQL